MSIFNINEFGNPEIGGCDLLELVQKYGTPMYVIDEDKVRKNCKTYVDAINKHYGGNGLALYASKALCCLYMCKLVHEEGMGLDVASGGELYTALKAGFPVEKIYFHGNNKTYSELELAVNNNIGRIVVDNFYELEQLNEISMKHNKNLKVSIRVKPGVDAHTHEFIRTGQIDSKFGVALENGEAHEMVKKIMTMSNIELGGLHCHIGSQIFDIEPFELATEVMMNFIVSIKNKFNIEIGELNLGGGYGIKYTEEDNPIEYNNYIEKASQIVKNKSIEGNIKKPMLVFEPGRSIVGGAGITLDTEGSVKEIPNVRKYVAVDGGMTDNPRYVLYQSKYEAVLVNKPNAKPTETVTIAGKSCESGDILIKDIRMPKIESGDILAVLSTGAYNYSMASNYNRIPRPPIVMVSNGESKLIVKRETYDNLIINDLL